MTGMAATTSNNSTMVLTTPTAPKSAKELMQSSCFTSLAIRQEIGRFESVHPAIYAVYDLLDTMADPALGQQIRDHVVSIEGQSPFCLMMHDCAPGTRRDGCERAAALPTCVLSLMSCMQVLRAACPTSLLSTRVSRIIRHPDQARVHDTQNKRTNNSKS